MVWGAIAGAAIGVVGGAMQASKGRKGQQQQARRLEEAGRGNMEAQYLLSNQQRDLANQSRSDYAYRPVQVNNGYGQSYGSGEDGNIGFRLNSDWQGLYDQQMGMANKSFGLAGSMDPKAFAADRYNAAQGLLSAGDDMQNNKLMQSLYTKGGFGVTGNMQQAGGGGVIGMNPMVNAFMDSRNERDQNMSWRSLGEGESYVDRLLGRGKGMMGGAMDINNKGAQSMSDAMVQSQNYNNMYRAGLDPYYKGMGLANTSQFEGTRAFYNAWGGIDAGASANNQAQMINRTTSDLKGLNWNQIIGGMTGGGGGSGPMTQAPIYEGGVMRSAPIYG